MYERNCRHLVTIAALAYALMSNSAAAIEENPWNDKCVEVIKRANIYFTPKNIVGVSGNKTEQICEFFVDGATRYAESDLSNNVNDVISDIKSIQYAFSKYGNAKELSNFDETIANIEKNIAILLTAPSLSADGMPKNALFDLVSKHKSFITVCISDFYTDNYSLERRKRATKDRVVSCAILGKKSNLLETKAEFGPRFNAVYFTRTRPKF